MQITKDNIGEYFIGLDIGTNSVGWAVTDKFYNILKINGKMLWGIRLFEEGNKADERRISRSSTRRIKRKTWRLGLLQELFSEEIAKIDKGFYQRLKDSKYWADDKEILQYNTLFNDEVYCDVEFHKEFPTIYHLRKALICGEKEYDIRLIYLALHHIIKNRGHFLFEGQEMNNVTSFDAVYNDVIQCLSDTFDRTDIECQNIDELKNILLNKKITKSDKEKKLIKLFAVEKEDKQLKAILGLIAGTTKKISDIFNDSDLDTLERTKICFSDDGFDEYKVEFEPFLLERMYVLEKLKAIYDWTILTDILKGHNYISYAKVEVYEKHKDDLENLKILVKKYIPTQYDTIFKVVDEKTHNYCSYVGLAKKNGKKIWIKNKCNQQDFCAFILKKIKDIDIEETKYIYIKEELEQGIFMPKQVSKSNGVIPYQVHEAELKDILKNAAKYLTFLNEVDEMGLSVSEKIVKTFKFKIPYYVGPLNSAHRDQGANNWIVRKTKDRILPWNFEEVVDVEGSAREFITRMTNKCTYLVGEDVLPKNSLLYSEYMVLNELNNLRINQEKISVELKEKIYNSLFLEFRKVTRKRLLKFLKIEGYEVSDEDITGIDGDFKTSMSTFIDFKEIFGGKIKEYKYKMIAEQIILWSCLYGEDKILLKNAIKRNYSDVLTVEEIKLVSKKKYTGWGNFSEKFLCEIEGASKETGEVLNIINALRTTNNNLMMLLSHNFTYLEEVDQFNNVGEENIELTYKLVEDLYVSPAVKHMLWQTLKIVKELKEILGKEPEKVFIEMARGENVVKKRTESRKQQLYNLYKSCKNETRDWCNEIEKKEDGDFRSDRLYLYYTQKGKCMYTGNNIPLEKLFDKNIYDIDHIYPQSKTKDDSLDNRVLVERTINADKDNTYPIDAKIRASQHSFWKMLKEQKMISQKKYDRLIRNTEFTDDELAGFISRQLVETQQTMKATADILKKAYKESEIVYVKSRLVSDFRRDYNILKVREVNDYHHAKDAYLNIVVGNVYNVRFTSNPINFIKKNKNTHYSISKVFQWDVERNGYKAWEKGDSGTIRKVKKILQKNNILYTRASFEGKGGLFNQTLYSKEVCQTGKGYIPLKTSDNKLKNICRYGGYGSIAGAYFFVVEHNDKKEKLIRTIETVPMYLKNHLSTVENLERYCREDLHLNSPRILVRKINMQTLIKVDGFFLHLTGRSNDRLIVRGAVQLCISNELNGYVKKLSKFYQRNVEQRDGLEITEYDAITSEENKVLYDALCKKHKDSIYANRPNPVGKMLEDGKVLFNNLSVKNQMKVLIQILQLSQCANLGADLSMIDGAKKAGIMIIPKDITKKKEFKIINQSVTGFFENEMDLLKI